MTQIKLFTKQKQTHREQTFGCQEWEEMREIDGLGIWGWQKQTMTFRTDTQGPAV